jgi:MYXO-CTERM domain-containing protein
MLATAAFLCATIHAAVNPVDIYVLRVGDGLGLGTGNQANPYTLMQFAGDGTLVNSWAAPSTDPATRITVYGDNDLYAHLNRSVDGRYLVFTGVDAPVRGTVDGEVIASFSLQTHAFDTSTRVLGAPSRFRAAATIDGSAYWVTGPSGVGISYAVHGGTSSARVSSHDHAYSGIEIIDDTVWFARRAASTRGVYFLAGGLPAEGSFGRTALTGSGWSAAAGDYNDFVFLNDHYLFVTNASSIEVFHRTDTATNTWNQLIGLSQGLTGLQGSTHLDLFDHGDHVQLYYTSGIGTNNSSLWTATWNPGDQTFGAPVMLADSGDGYSFGGVVVVPEPAASGALLGALALALLVRRRRRY